MRRDEVLERYRVEAARVLAIDESRIMEDARFAEDLGADSLDIVEILVFMEEDLNVDVPQHLLDGVRTVGQVVDLIHQRCEAQEVRDEDPEPEQAR